MPDAPADNPKAFVVRTKMSGNTLGFVKDKDSLFLFISEADGALVIPCFIPAAQIKELQIGPLLGYVLVEKQLLSADALGQALSMQAKLKKERIGSYLTDRASSSRLRS